MLFNSATYACFLALVCALYWALSKRAGARHLLLLVASYAFYANWDPRFLGLIVFSTLLDWTVGQRLAGEERPRARRAWLLASLVGNLGVLGFFKYFDFFSAQAAALLNAAGLAADPFTLDLLLPVGISFYTFQTLSYTIDVYRRELEPEPSLLRFAVFVAFFPQLVAGPIVRARAFLPQLTRTPRLEHAALRSGLALIFWGLTKKILLADVLGAELVDPAWESPERFGSYATALAINRMEIPPVHYMVVVSGGGNIRVAEYATYGTEVLSQYVLEAMEGRTACLMANHGMVATGPTVERALWVAREVEALARQYTIALQVGTPTLLTDEEVAESLAKLSNYGLRSKAEPAKARTDPKTKAVSKTKMVAKTKA
ncbi:MAG: class II aldolase/adducin family protein, partial [Planctomycetota bacterium]